MDILPLCHNFTHGHQMVVEGLGHFDQHILPRDVPPVMRLGYKEFNYTLIAEWLKLRPNTTIGHTLKLNTCMHENVSNDIALL